MIILGQLNCLAVGNGGWLEPIPGYLWAEQVRNVDGENAGKCGSHLEAVRVHLEVADACF